MHKHMQRTLKLGLYGLILTCSACKDDIVKPVVPGKVAPQMSESDSNAPSAGEKLTRQVASAVADLVKRSGISQDAITVVQARIVNWGSSAMGCPRKDMNYTQALVPGIQLLLEADGKIYRYHGGTESDPSYCPDERAEAPAYGQGNEFM